MTIFIALLRAINVGDRTVKMDRLRSLVNDFLSTAGTLRQRIAEWRETHQVPATDSTILLRDMRED